MLLNDLLFGTLPANRLYEFNLNWFLNRFHELEKEWDETKAAWIALKEYVDTFFDELDVQEEINKKLNEMYEDGTLKEVLDAIMFDADNLQRQIDGLNITMTNLTNPIPITSESQVTDPNKLYVNVNNGYVYYLLNGVVTQGWQYQSGITTPTQDSAFAGRCLTWEVSSVTNLMKVSGLVVYAFGRRYSITEEHTASSNVTYMYLNSNGNVTYSGTVLDNAGVLIALFTNEVIVSIDKSAYKSNGHKRSQTQSLDIYPFFSNALTLTLDTTNNQITASGVVFCQGVRTVINTTIPVTSTNVYIHFNQADYTVYSSPTIVATDILLAVANNAQIVNTVPLNVKYDNYEFSRFNGSTLIQAEGRTIASLPSVYSNNNVIDFESNHIYINSRINVNNNSKIYNIDADIPMTGFLALVINRQTDTLQLVTFPGVLDAQKYVIVLLITNQNYYCNVVNVLQIPYILINRKKDTVNIGNYNSSAIFGDSIAVGTSNINISFNLAANKKRLLNFGIGSSGWLRGLDGIPNSGTTVASSHQTGNENNISNGTVVNYSEGQSYDVFTVIQNKINVLLDNNIKHVFIFCGINDVNTDAGNFGQGAIDETNILYQRIKNCINYLDKYDIKVTYLTPIGQNFVNNSGNYVNNAWHTSQKKKFLEIIKLCEENLNLNVIHTDRLFHSISDNLSGNDEVTPETIETPFLSTDNLHPTTFGYGQIAKVIMNNYI